MFDTYCWYEEALKVALVSKLLGFGKDTFLVTRFRVSARNGYAAQWVKPTGIADIGDRVVLEVGTNGRQIETKIQLGSLDNLLRANTAKL